MITKQFSLNQIPEYPFDKEYDMSRIAFFDIETTGFAAEASYLYLIGCAFYKDASFHLIQWFSEDIHEEKLLLSTFFDFLKDYDVLIHYNGSGFDIPYLQRKIFLHRMDYSFDQIKSIDIYKLIYPYKKIFKVKNFKLKTIEAFLNIHRRDTSDGGALIQVYQSYLGKKLLEVLKHKRVPDDTIPVPSESDQLLSQLLLHNEDDIRGLLLVSPILYYTDLFEKPIRILQAGVDDGVLCIRFEHSASLPVRINFGDDVAHLTAFDRTATLTVQVYEGELKYFYDDYRDYYYLPEEDCAVHKSVAHFVDKNYRVKAKPSNCYTKKQGIFAPQYGMLITPCFKIDYHDKTSFLEIHTDFLLEESNLELYVTHMLTHMLSS